MSAVRCSRIVGASVALLAVLVVAAVLPQEAVAQVLGACGTPSENAPAAAPAEAPAPVAPPAMAASHMPLPGEHAINFELPSVVGDELKMVKLSDFNGKWRVVCFYPADFTFV